MSVDRERPSVSIEFVTPRLSKGEDADDQMDCLCNCSAVSLASAASSCNPVTPPRRAPASTMHEPLLPHVHKQPKPILKSIDNFNSENPEAATAAGSAAATIAAKKKCTRRPDGTARYGGGVC